jgi:hypothetical protein
MKIFPSNGGTMEMFLAFWKRVVTVQKKRISWDVFLFQGYKTNGWTVVEGEREEERSGRPTEALL